MGCLIKRAGTVPYCRGCDNTLSSWSLSSTDFNYVTISQEIRKFWLLTLSLLIFGWGCSSVIQSDQTPVARVDMSLRRSDISIGGPLSMTIHFGVLPEFQASEQNLRVLLHFVDSTGKLMWADDHEPVLPTSEWERGQKISYDRNVRVPLYPYVGDAVVLIGLYSPTTGERVLLGGEEVGGRRYLGGEISFKPQTDANFVTFGQGWYPEEFSPDFNDRWRWTSDRATLFFQNPSSDAVLYVEVDGRPDLFEVPQKVGFFIEGKKFYEFTLDGLGRRVHEIRLDSEEMGSRDVVRVDLEVDQTFRPEPPSDVDTAAELGNSGQKREVEKPSRNLSNDPRNLGIRVDYTFLEPI